MNIQRLDSLDDRRLDDFRNIRDAELVNRRGVVLCEGRLVVRMLLEGSRCRPRSVLLTEAALESVEDALGSAEGRGVTPPVYVISQEEMNRVVGFDIHRGCLAAADRPVDPGIAGLHADAENRSPVVVCESLTNHDNMGGIFRCAAALGACGIVVSPDCCDPLYRKSVRVSMGTALRLPFTRAGSMGAALGTLREQGARIIALTPRGEATIGQGAAECASAPGRIALLIGAEGAGLSAESMGAAHVRARIEMSGGIDSLNATNACAIALYAIGTALGRVERGAGE